MQPVVPEPSPAEPVVELAERILKSETSEQPPVYGPFRCVRTCAPGAQESLTLSITPEDEKTELTFHPETLRGPGNTTISSSQVTITPIRVSLDQGQGADVKVSLTPPPETPPGLYQGKIVVEGTVPAVFRIEFEIAPPN